MARAQIKGIVHGASGRVIANAKIFVYETGTTNPIADLYLTAVGGSAQGFLTSNTQGEYEGWLTTPRNVAVECTDNSDMAYYSDTVGAEAVPESSALATHLADEDAHLHEILIVASHSGDLTVETGTVGWPVHRDITLTEASYLLTTSPTGSSAIFDIILHPPGGGSASIFDGGNKPTVVAGETDFLSLWTPDTTTVLAGSYFTFNRTQIGSSTPGANLTVVLRGS